MSLSTWRTAVRNKVAGVAALAGVPVYDYLRHVTDELEIKNLLVAASRLHAWQVTLTTDPAQVIRYVGQDQAIYGFDIHGYYALADAAASEKAFLDVAEAVFDALRLDVHILEGGGARAIHSGPPQWPEHNHVMFAGVLCHHVRFTYPVKTQLVAP